MADSSANILTMSNADFSLAPLKIIAAEREFVDDASLDIDGMIVFLLSIKVDPKHLVPIHRIGCRHLGRRMIYLRDYHGRLVG